MYFDLESVKCIDSWGFTDEFRASARISYAQNEQPHPEYFFFRHSNPPFRWSVSSSGNCCQCFLWHLTSNVLRITQPSIPPLFNVGGIHDMSRTSNDSVGFVATSAREGFLCRGPPERITMTYVNQLVEFCPSSPLFYTQFQRGGHSRWIGQPTEPFDLSSPQIL